MGYFGRKVRLVIWIAARMGRRIDHAKALKIAARFDETELCRINKALGGKRV